MRKARWTSESFLCRAVSTAALRGCRLKRTGPDSYSISFAYADCSEVIFGSDGDPKELRGCTAGLDLVMPSTISLKKVAESPATWGGGFSGWYWVKDHDTYCCPGVWLVEPKGT